MTTYEHNGLLVNIVMTLHIWDMLIGTLEVVENYRKAQR